MGGSIPRQPMRQAIRQWMQIVCRSHNGKSDTFPDLKMARCEEELVKGPLSPRVRSRVSSRNQTPVPSQAEIPKPRPASSEAPVFATKLVAFDKQFSKWVHESCLTDFTYSFLRFFEYSGDGLFWIPATAVFWLSSSAGSAETRMFALNLFICLLLDLIVVGTIKSAVRRKRPQYNRGHLVIVSMDHWSFPSGHSTRAVMVVTLIWLYTPLWQTMINQHWYPNLVLSSKSSYFMRDWVLPYVENNLLTIGKCAFMLWMLATACSRVVLGRHYLLDVMGGVVVGVLEAFVAHFALHVPLKVSELQHAYLLSLFGLYEEAFWKFFQGRWFISSHDFREMNRQIIEADQGLL